MKWHPRIALGLFLLGSCLYAENFDPFAKAVVPSTIANFDPFVMSVTPSASTIPAAQLQTVDSQGREAKAAAGAMDGSMGNVGAIATGTALLTAGVALLPDLFTRPEGIMLISMAGQEFAQAATDKGSALQNGAQRDLLQTSQSAPGSNLPSASGVDPNSLLSPQLEQALSSSGVNPQDFVNQLANGQLTNPNSVANAFGGDFSSLFPPVDSSAQLQMDPVNKQVLSEESPNNSSFGTLAGGGSYSAGQTASTNITSGILELVSSKESPVPAARTAKPAEEETEGKGGGFDAASLAQRYLGPLGLGGAEIQASPEMIRVELQGIGIQAGKVKQTIFQVARRNYRNFGKWRKGDRIARND